MSDGLLMKYFVLKPSGDDRYAAAWMLKEHERRRLEKEEAERWKLSPEELERRRQQVDELLKPNRV